MSRTTIYPQNNLKIKKKKKKPLKYIKIDFLF